MATSAGDDILRQWRQDPVIDPDIFSELAGSGYNIGQLFSVLKYSTNPSFKQFILDTLIPSMDFEDVVQYPQVLFPEEGIQAVIRDVPEMRELTDYIQSKPDSYLFSLYGKTARRMSLDMILNGDRYERMLLRILRTSERFPEDTLTEFVRILFNVRSTDKTGLAAIKSLTEYVVGGRSRNDMLYVDKKDQKLFPSDITIVQTPNPYLRVFSTRTENKKYAFPVTRYISAEGGGAYWPEQTAEPCGTFYYYEPNSLTLLYGVKVLFTPRKSFALFALTDRDEFNRIYNNPISSPYDWIDKMREEIDLHVSDAENLDPYSVQESYIRLANTGRIDFYSLFDMEEDVHDLDETICAKAKAQGYDLVVFGMIIDVNGFQGEILDVRPRNISYNNLYAVSSLS